MVEKCGANGREWARRGRRGASARGPPSEATAKAGLRRRGVERGLMRRARSERTVAARLAPGQAFGRRTRQRVSDRACVTLDVRRLFATYRTAS